MVHNEALAVISILQHLRKILYGCKLYIYTDSLNLSYIQTSTSRKLQRYHMEIADFDCGVRHIAGVDNVVADYISRMNYCSVCSIENSPLQLFPLSIKYVSNKQEEDDEIQRDYNKYDLAKIENIKCYACQIQLG